MSSLLHPVGHLPASAYWVRRALVLALLLILVIALFQVFGGGGDPKPAASAGPVGSPSSTAPVSTPSPSPDGSASPGGSSTTSTPRAQESRQPRNDSGRCTGSMVRVEVQPAARRVSSGRPLNFQVQLSTSHRDGCAAVVDATRLVVSVMSGKDRIWTSAHCVKAVSRATLALSAKEATSTVAWNGRRSAAGCPTTSPAARPGTYVVQAAYDGSTSVQQAFLVV